MSFYTSLTGLNAATAMLGVTSNNIANVGTTGFKRSRADFGDIFATSPLQKASSTVGQGVSLKQVSQEFSQGNISFSSNALDLAVTGDGFFPMRSADGLQESFTRNGSFLLNEQFNVVNSAGQRLMASTVDSTGSANVNERVVLTIPQKTSGEAKQTSQVALGLNFPADASVITAAFNRSNPATYNKSTAFTVYDNGGNGYLATIYYVKSQNANQSSPYNKWQTHVFVGSDEVTSSLQQATDKNGSLEYVNKYGVIKPYSEVKDALTTAKTQMFSLNQLTDSRTSVPAEASGVTVPTTSYDLGTGVDFSTLSATDLKSMFKIDVDGTGNPITVDLSYLANSSKPLTGGAIASEVTNLLNQKFGDEHYFDFSSTASKQFTITNDRVFTSATTTDAATGISTTVDTPTPINFTLVAGQNGLPTDMSKVTIAQAQAAMQALVDASPLGFGKAETQTVTLTGTTATGPTSFLGMPVTGSATGDTPASTASKIVADKVNILAGAAAIAAGITDISAGSVAGTLTITYKNGSSVAAGSGDVAALAASASAGISFSAGTEVTKGVAGQAETIKVSYDYATQGFKFLDGTHKVTLSSTVKNDVLGLTTTPVTLDDQGAYAAVVTPNSSYSVRLAGEQRYGMTMLYDSVNKVFKLQSGTTGDSSSIAITETNALAQSLFGLSDQAVATSAVALRGTPSTPAIAYGTAPTVNINNNFAVDATNNKFVVTVDGVKGTVTIPVRADYSLATFKSELQKGINSLASDNPNASPTTINGVTVDFDATNNRFTFQTGTATANSFITVSGSTNWGLDQTTAGRGTTSTWINPTQHQDLVGGALQPKYIDSNGKETTSGDGFSALPEWSPIYLDKGELTFDTGGKLVSPAKGTQLDTVYLAGGKGALTINVNYSASTQYTSPFAVLSQSQDGAPEGDLVGVTIGNDGLVSASFSNGTQKSLAKILLVNFSSPVGLRQIGDSSFLASAASGKPILGTAGSAGFGTLRAGATERANVDLTQELVDLITAQRNFQANAKAIETSTTMTSAIINMRAG